MKICPECQSKYTDDTLKFCLQDGTSLTLISNDKTQVFDQDSFSNDETIAENFSGETEKFNAKTIAIEKDQSDEQSKSIDRNEYVPKVSQETIPRRDNAIKTNYAEENQRTHNENKKDSKSGLGFLSGFLIAMFFVGFLGIAIFAVLFSSGVFEGNSNLEANINRSNIEKGLLESKDIKSSASSSRKAENGNFYTPNLALDGNSRTAWSEGAKGAGIGQWIAFDFNTEQRLKKIIIEPGYFKTDELWEKNNRLKEVFLKFSDGTRKKAEFTNEKKIQTINTEKIRTKSVIITINTIYPGRNDSKDTLISEVKFVVE